MQRSSHQTYDGPVLNQALSRTVRATCISLISWSDLPLRFSSEAGVAISMDGRGRWMDNVFIERLWRSLKYEDVYLKGYADGREAARGIAAWIAFYNDRRPHQALADRTPMAVWREAIAGAGYVDMMDNASALPTCPQQQKQTQTLAA